MKNKINNEIDNIAGKVKEVAGKLTNQEELELKGKMQSMKSDMMAKGEELKEKAAAKANDFIDKVRND